MHKSIVIILIFIYFVISIAFGVESSRNVVDIQWARLNHFDYSKGKSRISAGSPFFISKNGHLNLIEEKKALIRLLNFPEKFIQKYKIHPICAFPARYSFLKKRNLISKRAYSHKCMRLKEWKKKINPSKIKIVLASQFISNPASAMGHTFLKLQSAHLPEYLSTAISYAADVDKNVGVWEYATKGIFGGFKGVFSETLFYEKVHEYKNIERRDLWEYELDLTKDEIDFFINHLWELSNFAKFSYYFIDENCSYLLLAIVEAIKPNIDLIKNFSTYVIPHDTIKVLNNKKLIKSEKQIPSYRKNLIMHFSKLEKEEKTNVLDIIRGHKLSIPLSVGQLDTLLASLTLKKYKNEGFLSVDDRKLKNQLLIRRSKNKKISDEVTTFDISPLNTHEAGHLEVSQQLYSNQSYYSMLLRPGFHNIDDGEGAFLTNSTFNFFEIEMDNYNKSLNISSFKIFDIKSFVSNSEIDPQNSWSVNLGLERSLYEKNQKVHNLSFSYGKSYNVSSSLEFHILVYSLNNHLILDNTFHRYMGPQLVITNRPSKNLNVLFDFKILFESRDNPVVSSEYALRKINFYENIDIRVKLSHIKNRLRKFDKLNTSIDFIRDF